MFKRSGFVLFKTTASSFTFLISCAIPVEVLFIAVMKCSFCNFEAPLCRLRTRRIVCKSNREPLFACKFARVTISFSLNSFVVALIKPGQYPELCAKNRKKVSEKPTLITSSIFKPSLEENMHSEVRISKYSEPKTMLDSVTVAFSTFSKDEVVKFSCRSKDETSR